MNLIRYCSQSSLSLSVHLLCTVNSVLASGSLIKVFYLWKEGQLSLLSKHTLMQRRRHLQEKASQARAAAQDMKRALVAQHIHTIPTCNLRHICHKRNIRSFKDAAQSVQSQMLFLA